MRKIIRLVEALALVAAFAVGYEIHQLNKSINIVNHYSLNQKPIYKGSDEKLSQAISHRQSVNILLLGTDTGALGRNKKFPSRSDTIMLCSLNPKTGKMLLVSMPRDMGYYMLGQTNAGLAKLNTAYALNGPSGIRTALQQHFNVPIDGYALINMGGLEDLLSAVGGVRVKSNLTFTQDWYHFKKGHYYHLHGKKALAYIRERHEDPLGDYGRQIRQRQVLKKIMHKMMKPKVLLNHKKIRKISKHVRSDLTKKDLVNLALYYRHCPQHIKQGHAQGISKNVYNMNYGLMEIEYIDTHEEKRVDKLIRKNMAQ